jgi:hypothetical protein
MGPFPTPPPNVAKPAVAPPKKNKGGRPKGSTYEKHDEPLARELLRRVDAGEGWVVASLDLARDAVGANTTPETKARRIRRLARERQESQENWERVARKP